MYLGLDMALGMNRFCLVLHNGSLPMCCTGVRMSGSTLRWTGICDSCCWPRLEMIFTHLND